MYSIKKTFRTLLFTAVLCCHAALAWADDYQKAWDALARNDRQTARPLLEKALQNPARAADAALTLLLLDTYDGHEEEAAPYWKTAAAQLKNPYPYWYALWFNSAVAGGYTLKNANQVQVLRNLIDDPKCPGSLKTSAWYSLGHHFLSAGQFADNQAAWAKTSPITAWQFAGPFDNLSGSGFDKNYPPVQQPEPAAVFKSTYNADIQWFKPAAANTQGYIAPTFFVRYNTGIVYAQSFVTAPADLNTTLALGFTGNIRVWVNDRLLLSEEEYRRTDFDVYKVKCALKKGVNRVLVQIGFEDEEYPNFCVRFVDDNTNLVPGLSSSAVYQPYFKEKEKSTPAPIPFFAETWFEEKVKSEPDNLLNYILLFKTYLRSGKSQEALAVIRKALEKAPDNNLLHLEYLLVLGSTQNRTEHTQELERLKETDPECATSLIIQFRENLQNENYEEAQKLLDRMTELYGEDEDVANRRIQLASARNNMESLLALIQAAHERYPLSAVFNEMAHNVELRLRKDPKAAIALDEQFLQKHFTMPTVNRVIKDCFDVGDNDKALNWLKQLNRDFPGVTEYQERLFNYYYGAKDAAQAQNLIDTLLGIAPYHADFHRKAALLYEQTGNQQAAVAEYQKALAYNPNDFDSRRRVRELQHQTDLTTLLPRNDPYALIRKSKAPADADWYFILDERATVLYPERCSETYYTIIVKILNDKGVDTWKDYTVDYNPVRQGLLMEKAEVVKPAGGKIAAEQDDNQVVFTNLAKGDAIYLRYRIVSYAYGRMAREYWDTYSFNAFVPAETSRLVLLAPKALAFQYSAVNMDGTPAVRDIDDFKLYTWESSNETAMKPEGWRPATLDIAKSIHLSTIGDWQDIADWYADASVVQARQDYEVKQAVQALFPAGKTFTPEQKARSIYDFVVRNITYSYVSFRQSAYVPQKASKVLQTKLGDCKDLATLYAAMAREAGLEANLVLLNTHDNGEQALPLPAVDFNHCIVKVKAGNQTWYLELTDPYLPFGSLAKSDRMGLALEIPFNGKGAQKGLFQLSLGNRSPDFRHQTMQVAVKNTDLNITVNTTVGGALSSDLRSGFSDLSREKQIEDVQKTLGSHYSSPVSVQALDFGALDQLRDTLQFQAAFTVRNKVMEIGDLRSFQVPFYYTFLEPDAFQEETRHFPISYWEYEDADAYREDIHIQLPEGRQLSDIPKNVALRFGGTAYELTYAQQAPGALLVTRHITIDRGNIAAKDYPAFREFLDQVVAAEKKYLAFK